MSQRDETLYMCRNHHEPFLHHGKECPWCTVTNDLASKMRSEYKRGFADGVMASDRDHAERITALREQAFKHMKEMEDARAERSSNSAKQAETDTAVPAHVHDK